MDLVADDFLARLRTFVRRRVGAHVDAEDVVQTVLLRLLQTQPHVEIESPIAWVLSTARTVIADMHRARSRSDEPLEEEPVATADRDDERDVTRCVSPLLRSLGEDDRHLLERVDMRGESQVALAHELGLTPSAVKSRVQRARDRLRIAVLARCRVERDALGTPTGPASCKPTTKGDSCGCDT